MIDKHSPIPIYYQIEEFLKEKIVSKQYEVDQAIPSERELSEVFGVSRMTIRQALNDLVTEGYLYREKGKGTFVAAQKIEQPLHEVTGFSEDMLKRGMVPATRIIQFGETDADKQIAAYLKINEHDPIYKIERLRLADERPIALEHTYVPVHLVPNLTEDIVKESFYSYVEQHLQLEISHAEQTIEAGLANSKQASLLEISQGSPVLFIQQLTCLTNEQPIEWVRSTYRADRYKFHVNMKR
ncbi:GntR family transcriptional regulator [Pullulanibacillus pueri]|uniref:Phosphonate metabolism transcriptional regulator PhnF n=1 Tax=Pullulanibacillus pueri TaxID=1437324 RepID=A0A8J2ZVP4_9BACL|nr:GntR family transcriptional regulator [Pullulanibacillus pueri]MBM7682289.1 GntR family transcriptional regulator [Pullulanibacillus pueri]GGH80930.1 phosphonate metabolism transcriptional regulator PhnF [Pullulanibacillus pueri]